MSLLYPIQQMELGVMIDPEDWQIMSQDIAKCPENVLILDIAYKILY